MLKHTNKKQKLEQQTQQATQYNHSVVKITSTDLYPDHQTPWKGVDSMKYRGSGSVINQEKGWILTCAHVSNPRNMTLVRLGCDAKEYRAKVLICETDVDLAILQVDDPEFRQKAKAVSFGGFTFQPIGSSVTVVGYPATGNELTATSGRVSNNEIQGYVAGEGKNLESQVSAAINPGNSGGPVFNGLGEQTGVAFQKIEASEAEAAAYMVPATVIKHFLEMANRAIASGQPTSGVPHLPIQIQVMKSAALRAHYGMNPSHTGVRVKQIDTLADVGGLQVDDIILSIDGHRIQNDATFNSYKEISERLNFMYLIFQKHMGQTLNMRVWRNSVKQELSLSVPLKYRVNQLKLIGRLDMKPEPTFYLRLGIFFQPLTVNYLVSPKGRGLLLTHNEKGALADACRTAPDEQLIVINTVLDSDHTYGYEEVGETDLVDTINGVKIRNMRDLIFQLESKQTGEHCIVLQNNIKIAIGALTPEQDQEIALLNKIMKTHSDDLTPIIQAARAAMTGTSTVISNQFIQQPVPPQKPTLQPLIPSSLKLE